MHVSLDIETLSTHKNAVVLSIGACLFTRAAAYYEPPNRFYTTLPYGEQIGAGRHVDLDTVKWWLTQEPETFVASLERRDRSVEDALLELEKWLAFVENTYGIEGVWCKGPSFDAAILEDLCEQAGLDCPVGFREWRDVRTIEWLVQSVDYGVVVPGDLRPHHALDDAVLQAYQIVEAWKRVKADRLPGDPARFGSEFDWPYGGVSGRWSHNMSAQRYSWDETLAKARAAVQEHLENSIYVGGPRIGDPKAEDENQAMPVHGDEFYA